VFVRRLTRAEAEDIYRIKEAVEPLMARWAAERPSVAQSADYRDAFADLGTAAAAGDGDACVTRLEACRRQLLRLAGSSPLRDILAVINGRVRLLRYCYLQRPGVLQISAEQHGRIAAAMASGDGDTAFLIIDTFHAIPSLRRPFPILLRQGKP